MRAHHSSLALQREAITRSNIRVEAIVAVSLAAPRIMAVLKGQNKIVIVKQRINEDKQLEPLNIFNIG